MGEIIKNPQQARSVETKQRIIAAGHRLIREKGYYNVTTPEIAKAAGVSTGILYRYFKNKLDIVGDILQQMVDNLVKPLLAGLSGSILTERDFISFLDRAADELCVFHEELGTMHNDLETLLNSENEIGKYYYQLEEEIVRNIEMILINSNIVLENMSEKVHIAFNLLEDYCHEKVFHNHSYIDYGILKQELIRVMVFILFDNS